MSTLFISRHPGARQWAEQQGIQVDFLYRYFDPRMVRPGDLVIGSLPVNLAARVCELGGRYRHLSLASPPARGGDALSAADMRAFGARLEEYLIFRVGEG